MTPVDAYPLQWPVGWTRTHHDDRRASIYQVSFARARDEVLRSVRLLGGVDVVISSDIALRRDGLPYANQGEPRDPGIAVYWTQHNQPRVMACDCWRTVRDNLRAVGLTIDALRAIDRSGATQLLERAFTGFAALPENAGSNGAPDWREVFCVSREAVISRAQLEQLYRAQVRHAHPDLNGGSAERMVVLNRARDAALREVGP
jgi:hypothetical protein